MLRLGFALLLTLMLPLQGYAAMPACAQHDGSNSSAAGAPPAGTGVAASPTGQHHCQHASTASRHRCDNCCCGAAIALTPTQWIAPLLSAPQVSSTPLWSPPMVALDRLDRPPRSLPA